MNNLTLRQLTYFEALAHEGHFGRAAERCAISQPALSVQIKDLEESLGFSLFERGPRHVRLTALGEAFAIRAGDILVGIDVWETISPENFAFLFNEITQSPRNDTVKFYLLRDDETVWGHMAVPKLPATSDSTPRPSSSNTDKSETQPSKVRF